MSQATVGVLEGVSPEATTAAPPLAPAELASPRAGVFASLVETTKPGITRLVTITSLVGFVLAATARAWTWQNLLIALLASGAGTALSAAGANAINQFMERSRDARMNRTMRRPLPENRLSPAAVLGTGVLLGIAGIALLWATVGAVPALISLACVLVYVLIYTPLKPVTVFSTLVGTIPGALPPLIGWTAAKGGSWASLLDAGGLSLFALMTVWQMPHFMAIAWMYRDDYARGGYRVLPVVDATGRRTATAIALWTSALLPASILPAIVMPEQVGVPYVLIACVTGCGFAWLAARLLRTRERTDARRLFFGSILHLPVLLIAMSSEALIRAWLR